MTTCRECPSTKIYARGKCQVCYNRDHSHSNRVRKRIAKCLKVNHVGDHCQSWLFIKDKSFMLADFTPDEGDPKALAEAYNAQMGESLVKLLELL